MGPLLATITDTIFEPIKMCLGKSYTVLAPPYNILMVNFDFITKQKGLYDLKRNHSSEQY